MKNPLIVKGKKAATSRLYYKTADLSHPWGSVKENFQTALQKMVDNPKRFVIIKSGQSTYNSSFFHLIPYADIQHFRTI